MIKAIRVILGLDAGGFLSGVNQSRSAWDGFTSSIGGGVQSAVAFLGHLSQIVMAAGAAIEGLINTARGLYDTFIGGYAEEQRFVTQLGVLMGSASDAKTFIDNLSTSNEKLGFITDDMLPSINAGATALRAMDGAVDPAKLEKYVDILRRIKAARPDIDYDTLSRAINRFISGDTEAFKRVLGVGIEDIQGLSEASQKALQDVGEAQGAQLGQVTRISGDATAKSGDMLAVLDEVTDKLGMGEEAVTAYSTTWEAQIKRLEEMWDNFKDTVAAPILEALMPELKKLADWLGEHKEDIQLFAERLGKLTAQGLVNAMEALMKVDWDQVGKGAEKILDAFSHINWEAVGKAAADISNALGAIYNVMGTPQGNPELAGEGAANAVKGFFGMKPEDSIFSGGKTTAGMVGMGVQQAIQEVKVTISVDDDGKIKALAQKEANSAVGDFVKAATGSTGAGTKAGAKEHNT